MEDNKNFDVNSADNLGNNKVILESLCDDNDKPYLRAYWEYKTINKQAAIKKYPQWAEQFAIDYAGEVQ
jgi:hypothetical protein